MSPFTMAALLSVALPGYAQSPDNLEAWRQTADRFEARTTELADETEHYIEVEETRHRQTIETSYTPVIASLDALERSRRDQAVVVLEDFLDRRPSARGSSHVRLRLAELYYELAEQKWQAETAAWEVAVDKLEANDPLPVAPELDLARPVALYETIERDNAGLSDEQRYAHVDAARFMWAWAHKDPHTAQYDPERARSGFDDLLRERPDSDFAAAAHLLVGNYAFEDGNYDGAVPHYRAVLDSPDDRYDLDASYRLAWAHYAAAETEDRYRMALDAFARVLDTGEPDYEPEALRYVAISLIELGNLKQQEPGDLLWSWRAEREEAGWERDAAIDLGGVLEDLARVEEAIDLYDAVLDDPRWSHHPEAPALHAHAADLWMKTIFPDPGRTLAERVELGERFGPGSDWWAANAEAPIAREQARALAEVALGSVAREAGIAAMATHDADELNTAADRFQTYLELHPTAEDWEQMQWYLGLVLHRAGRPAAAGDVFERLVRTRRVHEHGDGAVFEAMRAHHEAEDDERFEAAVERARSWHWSAADEGDIDYGAAFAEREGEVLYALGRVRYDDGRLDSAREVLHAAVDSGPPEVASNAAQLILKSYADDGDHVAVAKWSRAFTPIDRSGAVQTALYWAEFQACIELAVDSDLEGAGCYARYADTFKESEYHQAALLNAANGYERGGDHRASAETLERLLGEAPNHADAAALRWRVATSWENQLELERAVKAYLTVVERHPTTDAAPDALFNAAGAMSAVADHKGAARAYERYGEEYADQDDAAAIVFRAGEQWSRVSDTDERRFWTRYLRAWPDASADHQLVAHSRLAAIARDSGLERTAEHHERTLLRTWSALAAAGEPVGRKGRAVAGAAAVRDLEPMLAAIEVATLTGDEARDAELVTTTLPEAVGRFDEAALGLLDYKDASTTLAALYRMGRAHIALTELGYGVRCPNWMTAEEVEICEEVLDETIRARMDVHQVKAMELWQKVVDTAEQLGLHDDSVELALEALNDVNPREHPAPKLEKRPRLELDMLAPVEPMRLAEGR